ncbi:MAG: LysM peptidoglycan-binding domain-containing protein [Oligoflexales bacterium]|nr:LysM peptidoglycan-binding domain-containing protein [Oligoflexales bacterium]
MKRSDILTKKSIITVLTTFIVSNVFFGIGCSSNSPGNEPEEAIISEESNDNSSDTQVISPPQSQKDTWEQTKQEPNTSNSEEQKNREVASQNQQASPQQNETKQNEQITTAENTNDGVKGWDDINEMDQTAKTSAESTNQPPQSTAAQVNSTTDTKPNSAEISDTEKADNKSTTNAPNQKTESSPPETATMAVENPINQEQNKSDVNNDSTEDASLVQNTEENQKPAEVISKEEKIDPSENYELSSINQNSASNPSDPAKAIGLPVAENSLGEDNKDQTENITESSEFNKNPIQEETQLTGDQSGSTSSPLNEELKENKEEIKVQVEKTQKLPKKKIKSSLKRKEVASTPETSESTTDTKQDAVGSIYVIEPGDTLASIAQKIYNSPRKWKELATINNIQDPYLLFPGDALKYKSDKNTTHFNSVYENTARKTIVVKQGDTLGNLAKKLFGNSSYWKTIWKLNTKIIKNPNMIYEGQKLIYIDQKALNEELEKKHNQMKAH